MNPEYTKRLLLFDQIKAFKGRHRDPYGPVADRLAVEINVQREDVIDELNALYAAQNQGDVDELVAKDDHGNIAGLIACGAFES